MACSRLIGIHVVSPLTSRTPHCGRTPLRSSLRSRCTRSSSAPNCGSSSSPSSCTTLVFGRFFCGWACHIVALQDLCAWLMKKAGVRPRPFRARILALAPLVLALYMFAWPTFKRLVLGSAPPFPGLTNHLMTSGFWETFPGPLFAVLTFLVCGFTAVYFLGAKGFCTYGCPYGALFMAGRVLAGKIVVSDPAGIRHCTPHAPNLRVHEDVAAYGPWDPGHKCMDCGVSPQGG